MSASASLAAVIDLGFSLDASGSVGSSNFTLTKNGLSKALEIIPTSGDTQYRIAVTTFSTGVNTIVSPTIITDANIGAIKTAIESASYTRGWTNTALAIENLTSLFQNSLGGMNDTALLNLTTDGDPTASPGNGTGSNYAVHQAAAVNAAAVAYAGGVDGISFEAIGAGASTSKMLEIAQPKPSVLVTDLNNFPDATENGFVVPVSSFVEYEAAISAKIRKVVIDTGGDIDPIPLPAGMPLLLAGMGAFAWMRRRQHAA